MLGFKFGVEMEAIGLDKSSLLHRFGQLEGVSARTDFDAKFIPASVFSYSDFSDLVYRIKTDGSLTSPGSEVVSPILTESGLPTLKRTIGHMKSFGMYCDRTAGLHVHVGIPEGIEITPERLDILYQNWDRLRGSTWRNFKPNRFRNKRYGKFNFPRGQLGVVRELGINITRSRGNNTIEFRLFDGHLDFRYVCRAVRFSCTMAATCFYKIDVHNDAKNIIEVEKIVAERLGCPFTVMEPASVG